MTLRAVSIADNSNNTPTPYTRSNGGQTYTFDVSGLSSDTLDLAIPALTDLQLTATNGAITVSGVNGQMTLSAANAPITITGSTLDGSSGVRANNGGLILNTVTFSSDANLSGANGDATLANVHFHGSATLDVSNGSMTANGTTFAGAASLTIDTSGHITTTNTTFHSTALLSAPNGAITLTSTTFAGKVTVTDTGTFTTTQTTFQAGAIVKALQAMNIAATFGEQGTYELITSDGDIDLTLSTDLSFHLDASTNNGSISSDFPTIRVTTDPNTNATAAHGPVGQGELLRGSLSPSRLTMAACAFTGCRMGNLSER